MRPARTLCTTARRFAALRGIDLGSKRAPDATTLLKFRRLLEQPQLGEALMERVRKSLVASEVKVVQDHIQAVIYRL